MREIKFRGKRVDNGEWVYGFFVGYSAAEGYIYGDYIDKNEVWKVDTNSVGQYIGQKDELGEDIYDGDILHTNEADWIAQVLYHYDGFMLTGLDHTGFSCSPDYDKCKVITNKIDHPELIKNDN